MKYRLKIYSIWEYGRRVDSEGKPHQEDSLFPAYGQQKDTDRLFILCDGMGGHAAGEVASATVCEAMSRSVFRSAPDAEGDFSDGNLYTAIDDAFHALSEAAKGNETGARKMGTTMAFLKFHSRGCTIAHIGDSRVYHIRPGKGRDDSAILFRTSDHSLVNDLIKVGELTPEEAKHSPQKNVITRAMQPNPDRQPRADIYHTADIRPGDWFYMCSDGMLEEMEDDNLLYNFSEATGDDARKVKILTQATSQSRDNHSAILVHVMEVIDPLPTGEAPSADSVAEVPQPIMAEIGEDETAQIEGEKETTSSGTALEAAPDAKRTPGFRSKGKRMVKYIVWILLLLLIVGGIYLVSSWLSARSFSAPVPHGKPEPGGAVAGTGSPVEAGQPEQPALEQPAPGPSAPQQPAPGASGAADAGQQPAGDVVSSDR